MLVLVLLVSSLLLAAVTLQAGLMRCACVGETEPVTAMSRKMTACSRCTCLPMLADTHCLQDGFPPHSCQAPGLHVSAAEAVACAHNEETRPQQAMQKERCLNRNLHIENQIKCC